MSNTLLPDKHITVTGTSLAAARDQARHDTVTYIAAELTARLDTPSADPLVMYGMDGVDLSDLDLTFGAIAAGRAEVLDALRAIRTDKQSLWAEEPLHAAMDAAVEESSAVLRREVERWVDESPAAERVRADIDFRALLRDSAFGATSDHAAVRHIATMVAFSERSRLVAELPTGTPAEHGEKVLASVAELVDADPDRYLAAARDAFLSSTSQHYVDRWLAAQSAIADLLPLRRLIVGAD